MYRSQHSAYRFVIPADAAMTKIEKCCARIMKQLHAYPLCSGANCIPFSPRLFGVGRRWPKAG